MQKRNPIKIQAVKCIFYMVPLPFKFILPNKDSGLAFGYRFCFLIHCQLHPPYFNF